MSILEALWQALCLLFRGDPQLLGIVKLSFEVSGIALAISAFLGIPAGAFLGLHRVPGRRVMTALIYTGMGLPPVVVGLVVYMLLSRSGPFGWLGWLFTPRAMILAQVILAFPVIAGFVMASVMGVDPELSLQLRSLGATRWRISWTILREARHGVLAALVAGFGSIISEVGSVMMVGGNIEGRTRVLTTAIVLETQKGNFPFAIALGFVLLGIVFVINAALILLQGDASR